MRLLLVAFVLAISVIVGNANAQTDQDGTYTTVEMGEQEAGPDGQARGPWKKVDPADHRPDRADEAGRREGGKRAVRSLFGSGCKNVYASRIGRSYLGTELWRYRVDVRFCWNQPKVTGVWTTVTPTVDDWVWRFRGTIASQGYGYIWCCGVSGSGWQTYRRGWYEQFVPQTGFVVSSVYPWVRFYLHGDGSWNAGTGV